MAKKLGTFTLKQYTDNSAFVEFSTDKVMERIVMFAFYIDRVIHNLPQSKASHLITVIETTATNFLVPFIKGKSDDSLIDKLLEKAHFGMKLEKYDIKKSVFEALGEYFEKGSSTYMQTKFKPVFVKNDTIENYAMGSFTYLFDYIISYISDEQAKFLMLLMAKMSQMYRESGREHPIGIVPRESIIDTGTRFDIK